MLIEDGYAHSLKSLLDKSRARDRSPLVSDIVVPRWVVVFTLFVFFCLTLFLASFVV
jgi:hypothetical protein